MRPFCYPSFSDAQDDQDLALFRARFQQQRSSNCTWGRRSGAAHAASVVDMQTLAEEASFWRQPTHAVRMSVERLRCFAACLLDSRHPLECSNAIYEQKL